MLLSAWLNIYLFMVIERSEPGRRSMITRLTIIGFTDSYVCGLTDLLTKPEAFGQKETRRHWRS